MSDENLITPQWLDQLEATLFKMGKTQMLTEADTYRLMALSMVAALVNHTFASELGAAATMNELRSYHAELSKSADPTKGEMPSLSEQVIYMEMGAAAFSMVEHRCRQIGDKSLDVSTAVLAPAFMHIMRRSVAAGGAAAAGALLHVMQNFVGVFVRKT